LKPAISPEYQAIRRFRAAVCKKTSSELPGWAGLGFQGFLNEFIKEVGEKRILQTPAPQPGTPILGTLVLP
jgi:hypothetical protein